MNTIVFTISSGGIGEDLSARKPIKLLGNPRRKCYTYRCLKDAIFTTRMAMLYIVNNAIDYNKLPNSRRRKYQRLRNRMAALKYAKLVKDL